MEENNQDVLDPSVFDLTISDSVIYSLQQTCRWAALFVYVSGGAILLCLMGVVYYWSDIERVFYASLFQYEAIVYGILGFVLLVYVALLSLLFNFTLKVKKGIAGQDIQAIEQGVTSIKLYFILSVIFGMIYVLLALLGIVKSSFI